MTNELKEKLERELHKEIHEESQVVYILSRARKLLEINKKKKDFPILNFYCNWALHAEINDISSIKPLIDGILKNDGTSVRQLVSQFKSFHAEFQHFLAEFELTTILYDSDNNLATFNQFLGLIYSDTPLIVDKEMKITWNATSITFTIFLSFEDSL